MRFMVCPPVSSIPFRRLSTGPTTAALVLGTTAMLSGVVVTPCHAQEEKATIIVLDFGKVSTGSPINLQVKKEDGTTVARDQFKSVRNGKLVAFQVQKVNRIYYDVTIKGQRLTYNSTPPESLNSLLGLYAGGTTLIPTSLSPDQKQRIENLATQLAALQKGSLIAERLLNLLATYKSLDQTTVESIKKDAKRVVTQSTSPAVTTGVQITEFASDALDEITSVVSAILQAEPDLLTKENPTADEKKARAIVQDAQKVLAPENRDKVIAAYRQSAALFESIDKETVFTVTNFVEAGEDAIQFDYSIVPNAQHAADPDLQKIEAKSTTVPVIGDMRINFSGGLFLGFLGDEDFQAVKRTTITSERTPDAPAGTLVTQTGSFKTTVETKDGITTTTTEGRYSEPKSSDPRTYFPGALLHIYRRSDPLRLGPLGGWQPAFTFGGGVSNSNPYYVAGISFLSGDNRGAVVTLGLVSGKVKRLASGLTPGGLIPDDRSDITQSISKQAFVLAVTFRLGGTGGGTKK